MRILLLFLLASFPMVQWAQTISDCEGAIELCDDFYSEDQASLNTGTVYEFTGTCNNNLEQSSVWYTFTVQQDGLLSFILDPLNDNDDYDWGLFNITDGGCAGLGTTSPEVSCNSWGVFGVNGPTGISTADGGSGNSNGPGNLNGPPFNADLPVQAGETFALVIMNWSNSLDGYSIDFGGSTASLYDNIPPLPVEVIVDCANTSLVLVFSEPVLTSTVESLDFSIDGPGEVDVVSVDPSIPGATSDDMCILTFGEQLLETGTYTLTITDSSGFVTDACGNLGEGSITFEVFNPMTFEVGVTTACNGVDGSIFLETASGGEEPYVFRVNATVHPDGVADGLPDGSYAVDITDANGCQLTEQVIVPDNPIQVITGIQDTLSCLQPAVEIAGVGVQPGQPVSYSWLASEGGHITSGAGGPAPVVDEPGTYTVTATNTENGCEDTATVEVVAGEVYGIDVSLLVFPNIISPNKDDKNEKWAPFLANDPEFDVTSIFDQYELVVFNRWGGEVFRSSESERKWPATEVSEGTYFYTVYYHTNCGASAEAIVEGHIQVVR